MTDNQVLFGLDRSIDPDRLDINRTGSWAPFVNGRNETVTVFPPTSGYSSNVLKPDGTWLDTTGTTTSGLQEAINYSCGNGTAGSANYDLFIVGGEQHGASPGGAVIYNCSSPLVFPAMQGKTISSNAITLNFTGDIGSAPAVTFNSSMMVNVSLRGTQIVNGGTGPALSFAPKDGVPLDGALYGVHSIIDSNFYITTVVNINSSGLGGTANPVILFNNTQPTNTGINSNTFIFDEINQENSSANSIGIVINNPTGSGVFANNHVKCLHVHNYSGMALLYGVSASNTGLGNNYFHLIGNAKSGAARDFVINGKSSTFLISSDTTYPAYSVELSGSAFSNLFISSQLVQPILNNATATGKLSNLFLYPHTPVVSAVTPSGSPFTWQNTNPWPITVTVNGGTLSDETRVSFDNSSYYVTGQTTGQFYLMPGQWIRVFYSVAPAIWAYS